MATVRRVLWLVGVACAALMIGQCCIGCATDATEFRKVGFREIQRGYAAIPSTPGLRETVTLTVTVHIVGDRSQFDWPVAAAYGSPVAGYATRDGHVWLIGKEVNGRIIVNQAILGHEVNHLLQFVNSKVQDPDLLDDLGA